jgi:hypothetical protein
MMLAPASRRGQKRLFSQGVLIVGEDASENNLIILLLLHGVTPAGE